MDQIGELGLNVDAFSEAIDTINAGMTDALAVSKKLDSQIKTLNKSFSDTKTDANKASEGVKKLAQNTEDLSKKTVVFGASVNNLFRLAGAVIGIESIFALFNKLLESGEEAKKLNEDIAKIGEAFGSSEFKSKSGLETRLNGINEQIERLSKQKGKVDSAIEFIASSHIFGGSGYQDAIEKREGQINTLLSERKKVLDDIAAKGRQENQVLALRVNRQEEEAELLQNHQKYEEAIGVAIKENNEGLQVALHTQEKLNEELIKRKFLEQRQKVVSEIADDQAKLAIQNQLNDAKNEEIILDRQLDRQQDEKLAAEKNERDLDFANAESRKKELEKQIQQGNELYLQQQARNKETNKELENHKQVNQLQREGNSTAARREAMEQDFEKQIREAKRNNNTKGVDLLEKERNAARAGFDVEESKKTPRQRSNERKARRQLESNEAKAAAQNADLDDRLSKGARGDKDSRLEQRRTENARRAGRDNVAKVPDEKQGWSKSDSAVLQQIRDNLTNKDD